MYGGVLDDFAEWLKELLLWVPLKIWSLMLEGLAAVINAIPVPSWWSSISSSWDAAIGSVGYFVSGVGLGTAMGIIASAYLIRFLIRRIPVIG